MVDTSYMFLNCSSLPELNLKTFNTSKVENMEGMFEACININSIDLTSFKTEKCTNFKNIFKDCDENINVVVKKGYCDNLVESIKDYIHNIIIE